VKGFLRADSDYVYERDHKGRSPLILATMNNHTNLIKFVLDCDVNVNKRCFSLKTALYYAIRNKNVVVVKKLLQKGALPWSTKSCRYNQLMSRIKC
jgi:ankyrin repeat protein